MKGERDLLDPEYVRFLDERLAFGTSATATGEIETLAVKKSIDFPTVILPKQEYAHVMSELATNLKPRDYEKGIVKKAIGEYYYTVEVREFGDYRIIGKELIV